MTKVQKILIIDDEPDIVDTVAMALEASGYEVYSAEDGLAGLVAANKIVPDIILLDISMPRMDGYQVCKQLKATDKTKVIPILLLTAHVQAADREKGKAAGADGFIAKPFDMRELRSEIATRLN